MHGSFSSFSVYFRRTPGLLYPGARQKVLEGSDRHSRCKTKMHLGDYQAGAIAFPSTITAQVPIGTAPLFHIRKRVSMD